MAVTAKVFGWIFTRVAWLYSTVNTAHFLEDNLFVAGKSARLKIFFFKFRLLRHMAEFAENFAVSARRFQRYCCCFSANTKPMAKLVHISTQNFSHELILVLVGRSRDSKRRRFRKDQSGICGEEDRRRQQRVRKRFFRSWRRKAIKWSRFRGRERRRKTGSKKRRDNGCNSCCKLFSKLLTPNFKTLSMFRILKMKFVWSVAFRKERSSWSLQAMMAIQQHVGKRPLSKLLLRKAKRNKKTAKHRTNRKRKRKNQISSEKPQWLKQSRYFLL